MNPLITADDGWYFENEEGFDVIRKDCRKTNTGGEKNPTEGPFYNIKRRVRAPVYRVCLEFYSRARVFLEFYSRAGPFLSIL